MDNQNDIQEPQQLIVTEEMRSHFYEMSKWTRFLGVFGFVVAVTIILSAFSLGPMLQQSPELRAVAKTAGSGALTIGLIIYGLVVAYPSWLLIRYSKETQLGVLYGEQESLTNAVGKLKSLFKFWGILMAIIIVLYFLSVFGLVAGK